MVAQSIRYTGQCVYIGALAISRALHGASELPSYHSWIHELRAAHQCLRLDLCSRFVVCKGEEALARLGCEIH